jgi:hypothetical protein
MPSRLFGARDLRAPLFSLGGCAHTLCCSQHSAYSRVLCCRARRRWNGERRSRESAFTLAGAGREEGLPSHPYRSSSRPPGTMVSTCLIRLSVTTVGSLRLKREYSSSVCPVWLLTRHISSQRTRDLRLRNCRDDAYLFWVPDQPE